MSILKKEAVRRRRMLFGLSLAIVLALGSGVSLAVSWIDGTGLWTVGVNWDTGLTPPANSTVDISVAGPATVTFDSGSLVIANLSVTSPNTLAVTAGALRVSSSTTNTGTIAASGSGSFTANGIVNNAGGTLTAATGGTISLSAVRVAGGTIGSTGTGVVSATNSSNNFLDGVTLDGNLDLASAVAIERVENGLTLNGQIDVNSNSILAFNGANNLSGTGTIVLGNTGSSNRIILDGNGTTTLGADITVRGENGTIGGQAFVNGTQTLVNNGVISADVAGGLISIVESAVTNNATLGATNGATLQLQSAVTNGAAGVIDADAGTVIQNGARITGGTLTSSNGGTLVATNSSNNFLDGVTLDGDLDLASTVGIERVQNNLTLNGRIGVNSNSILAFDGTNNLSGMGTVVLGGAGANNRIILDGNGTTTLGADITVRGENGTIGGQAFVNGTQTLVNNGVISADVAGGLISIVESAVTNNGTLEAINGGELQLHSNVTGGVGSQISVGAGSRVLQVGVTISGDINTTGSGDFQANNSSNNFLDGVTLNGDLNLASSVAIERIRNDLALNGQIDVNSNSILAFDGTNNLSGMGTIVLGGAGAINRIILDGNGTTTLGADITVRGENGTIGGQAFVNGTQTLVNNGVISADVAGGLISIVESAVTNNATLGATNGATLQLQSAVTNGAAGVIDADAGTVIQNGARITGGTFTSSNGGTLVATNSSNNFLDGVTLDGDLDLASTVGIERVQNNLTLNGRIGVNSNSVLAFDGTNTVSGTGTIVLGNTGSNNRIILDGNGTTTLGADIIVRGENGTIGNQAFVNGTQTLVNNGTISADVAGGLVALNESAVTNNGTLQAANGGTLRINTPTDNQGLVEALADSTVRYATAGSTLNNVAGTLTGGIWRANSVGGGGANISLQGVPIVVNNADVQLIGAAASIDVLGTSIEDTLHTNDLALRLQQGHTFTATASGGNFTNNGILEVSDSTFESTTLVNDGAIASFGNSTVTTASGNPISGNGSITSSFGTLTLTRGVDMGIGSSMTSNSGAAIDLSNAAAPSRIDTLNNNGSLALGGQNIVVTKDYDNANFGTGNVFDRRANVTGAGQIIGDNAAQTITGNVIAAGANTFLLDLGNVRGGTSATADFQVANNGTGADIRGAIQTSAGGGNLTDSRVSGSGATAANLGPIAAGADSGNLTVSFDATTGGSLTGQTIAVVSNFDNVATQIINLDGTATSLAVGSATPNGSPVDLGNFRVGGAQPSQSFAVENTTTAPVAEQLGIASLATTGNFSASNNLGAGLIAGGASQAAAVSANVSGGVAGVNSGTLDIQYTTDGTAIDAAFVARDANLQTIDLQATGFQTATGQLNNAALNFGTVQVGQSVSQALSISNTAAGPSGFVEDLNARFGASSGAGAGQISGSGQIAGLLAGSTDASSMVVNVNTGVAGTIAGQIAVDYFSAGAVGGVSNGLGELAVGGDAVLVNGVIQTTGTVVDQARPLINTPNITLGNVRINSASPSANVSVSNVATGNSQAALNASISGNAPITAGGSFNLLLPGDTDSSSLQVGMDTSVAGLRSGTATIAFVSDADNIGGCAPNCQMTLASQDVNVQGAVYRLADPSLNTAGVLLAARRGDASPTAGISVSNNSPDAFTESLDASVSTASAGFLASGAVNDLLAGATDAGSLSVSLDTSVAGMRAGQADVAFVSTGAGTTGAADIAVGSAQVALTGKVYEAAVAQVNTANVDFGIVHRGDTVGPMAVSITNAAPVAGLNDVLLASLSGVGGPFTASGDLGAGLGAGDTDSSSLLIGLDTSASGVFGSSAIVGATSHDNDLADLALGNVGNVAVTAQVNEFANAAIRKLSGVGVLTGGGMLYELDLGNLVIGSPAALVGLEVFNDVIGPADLLDGIISLVDSADFNYTGGLGAFSGLDAGDGSSLSLTFLPVVLGAFNDELLISGMIGSNASGFVETLPDITLRISANVINGSVVSLPATPLLLLIPLMLLLRVRGSARRNAG